MNRPEKKALEITTEIVVAQMQNTSGPVCSETGKDVGDYFREIYNSVLEITKTTLED